MRSLSVRCKNDGFHFRASGPRNLSSFCPGGAGGGNVLDPEASFRSHVMQKNQKEVIGGEGVAH